jgi:hypothetical protein
LSDGLGLEEKAKSFLKLFFRESLLCFRQVLGMESFAELVGGRSGADEGW